MGRSGRQWSLFSILGDISFPLAIMACAMEDAKHDDGVGSEHEEHAVGETLGEDAAHVGLAAQAWELAGIGGGTLDGAMNLGEEFVAQPGALVVVPKRGLGKVGFGRGMDDEPVRHGRSLAWMRAFTSCQGLPALGLFW